MIIQLGDLGLIKSVNNNFFSYIKILYAPDMGSNANAFAFKYILSTFSKVFAFVFALSNTFFSNKIYSTNE